MNGYPWQPGELVAVPVSESLWALHARDRVVGYVTSTAGHAPALAHAAADYARCRAVKDRDDAREAEIDAILADIRNAPARRPAGRAWEVDPEPLDHPAAEMSEYDRGLLASWSGNPIWGYDGQPEGGAA
jgi:hypothetical protein